MRGGSVMRRVIVRVHVRLCELRRVLMRGVKVGKCEARESNPDRLLGRQP